jgi:hypothetical protein
MSGRSKARPESADARGGAFILLPHCLIKSPAYIAASHRAKAALTCLCGRHTGFNNGRIVLSAGDLAVGLDSQNHAANAAAMRELQERGIIALEKSYPRGSRMAREYRLTFVSVLRSGQIIPATNEYLSWTVGDAGTVRKRARPGKTSVAATAKESPPSSVIAANDRKPSVATTAMEETGNDANPPFPADPSVAVITRHISNHASDPSALNEIVGEKAGGVGGASCAPDDDTMRARVLAFLEGRENTGAQGRLADAAGVSAGQFSKFKKGGKLNDAARVRLACALPRLALKEDREHGRPERTAAAA